MKEVGFKISGDVGDSDKKIKGLTDEMSDLDYEIGEINKKLSELKKNKDKAGFVELKGEAENLKRKKSELNKEIRETQKTTNTLKKNMGDLVNQFRVGGVSVGEFRTVLGKTGKGLGDFNGALKISNRSIIANSGALRKLKIALAATGIGLLVVALGSLVAYLSKSQRGMDLFARAGAVVKSVIDNLIERAVKFGEGLVSIFSGNLREGFKQLGNSIKGLGTELIEDIKATDRLTVASQRLRDEERGLNVILAERRNKIKELNKDAENTALGQEKQAKAAADALEVSKQVAALENAFLDKKIANLREIQSLGESTADDEAELAALLQDKSDRNTANLETQTTIQNKLNTLTGVNKKQVEELVKGPLDQMKLKLNDISDLVGSGKLQGSALRDKILEMLNLQKEIEKMEDNIRSITEQLSRGATPGNFDPLNQSDTPIAFDVIGSLDPEVEKTRISQEEIRKIRKENNDQMKEDYLQSQKELKEEEQKFQEERLAVFADFASGVGDVVGEVLSGQIETLKDFEEALLGTLISSVEKAINILLAQAFARQFGDKPAPLAIAGFAVIQGLVKGFFAGVKSSVSKKRARGGQRGDGEVLQGASHTHGGIHLDPDEYEGGEAIINARSTRMFKPLLSAINSYQNYGKKFAGGGIRTSNNIPSFVGIGAGGNLGIGGGGGPSFVAEESISAMANSVGNAVRKSIGYGLSDAYRANERNNVYTQSTTY